MTKQNHRAPDGGWSWVICFGTFTFQALTLGITYTFGIIFVDLLAYFESSESDTAWIGSIQPFLLHLTGILVAPLLLRFGWRVVLIAGAIMTSVGYVTSAFVTQLWMLYITYGTLTGIGNGLMYVSSMVALQHYFNKHRAKATGIAASGSGVGIFMFGVVAERLLKYLGWRYTLIIEGCIIFAVGVPIACLFRPLPDHIAEASDDGDTVDEKSPLLGNKGSKSGLEASFTKSGTSKEHGVLSKTGDFESDFEVRGGCCQSACCGKAPSCGTSGCSMLSNIFDISLFCNPIFVFFTLSLMMFYMGYHAPYTFTPKRAILLGIEPAKASSLIAIIGISNVVARLVCGFVSDRSETFRFYFAGGVLVTVGTLTTIVFLFRNYPSLVAYGILFGICSGSFLVLFPVVLVDILGIHMIEKSLGFAMACASPAFLIASPLSGVLVDKTQNYDIPFMFVGSLEFCGGILFLLIKCLVSKYGYKEPDEEVNDTKAPGLQKVHSERIMHTSPSRISNTSG